MSHVHAHHRPHQNDGHPETYSARKHPEFVVLEIGEDIGALVVHTNPDMHGLEVEISPDGKDDVRSHKEVLERSSNGRPAYTAVFDGLRAGSYTLWNCGEPCARGVKVAAGQVAELDWRIAGRGVAEPDRRAAGGEVAEPEWRVVGGQR